MKKIVFCMAVTVFLAGCGKPKIEFEKRVHNFGDRQVKSKATHIFTFKNTGKGDLVINKVKATCSCTGTLLSKKRIAPGEAGEIKVTLKMSKRPYRMTRRVYVYTNDPLNKKVRLTVKANVKKNLTKK